MQICISRALPHDENPLNLSLQRSKHVLTTKTVPYIQSWTARARTHTLTVPHPVTNVLFRSSMRFRVLRVLLKSVQQLWKRRTFVAEKVFQIEHAQNSQGMEKTVVQNIRLKSHYQSSNTFSEGVI